MANAKKIFDAVLAGHGSINFHDFERLLSALGFRLARTSGSHRIYLHPAVGQPFPVQPDGKDAKRYQIRQLRDIIRKHRLTLD
jgi:predicted RNA binding protein YcfA (HicA-like mRNA interferase family)